MAERVVIRSTGSYLPKKILTNDELSGILGVEPGWITQRTGVVCRHVADENEATSDMATKAARAALAGADMDASLVDLLIVSTSISDTTLPPSACRVHRDLEMHNAAAFDLAASCSGFVYGAATAWSYIMAGFAQRVLLCCSELRSRFINYKDADTASVYGDGAGAVIFEKVQGEGDSGFIDIFLGADGRGAETITIPAGGTRLQTSVETVEKNLHYIHFHDRSIIKAAVRGIKTQVEQRLAVLGFSVDDIDLVIPHQMNLRMIESLYKRMRVDYDKFVVNIDRCGNTSSASIPIALDQALRNGRVSTGDLVLFVSYGAGFTWGVSLYRA